LDRAVSTTDAGSGQNYTWYCANRVVTISALWNHSAGSWDNGGMFWLPTQYAPPAKLYYLFAKDGVTDAPSVMTVDVDGHVMWSNRGGTQHTGMMITTGSYSIP
jgi:hypothetical protein